MALLNDFPRGWFWKDHIWWGKELDPAATFARGASIEVPDLRTADTRTLLRLREQNNHLLASISDTNAMQVHWSVEDDYHSDLDAYERVTETAPGMTRWSRDIRNYRAKLYRRALQEGALRRERVRFYIAQRCTDLKGYELKSLASAEQYMRGVARSLDARLAQMQASYSIARWTMFDTREHARHLREVLNPSIAREIAAGTVLTDVDEGQSIRHECLRSEVSPFQYGFGEERSEGLKFDGNYHALFVVTRNPAQTKPGMMLGLLTANECNCSIVQNIYPMQVDDEIKRLREAIAELAMHLLEVKAAGVSDEIVAMRARITSLLSSTVVPFKVLTVVRIWADTPEKLVARALATKGALGKLNGLGVHEVKDPVRARHLFLETLPGNLGSDYRGWDKYTENLNLADLMPVSATFTGHLAEAEALFDSCDPRAQVGSNTIGGIVGIRFFAGADSTPQSTTITGMTGAGKTSLMLELLAQMEHNIGYLYLQEEGMALATYAAIRKIPSLALKASSDYTLNPFDTFGLPLTGASSDTVGRVGMKLVGLAKDDDKNKRRGNLIGQYCSLLYQETSEDYKDRDERRWEQLTRRTMAVEKVRTQQDDFVDAFKTLRDLERADPAKVAEIIAGFREEDVVRFQTAPMTRDLISSMVFTQLKPEEYPQWGGLLDMMRSGRLSTHKTGAVADELTMLVTDLSQGKRYGGRIGSIIDGPTNVPLFGAGVHIDTSYLNDGILKEVAGFLFPEMARKHIMGMPRSIRKLMVLDELRRLLLIPGACEFVKEMLAQLRKYRACFIGAFQSPSQIDEIDPALAALLMGQCKQHFLLRQNDSGEMAKIAHAIRLPEVAQRAILTHPLLEHQKGAKAAYFTLFSDEGNGQATCGTVRVVVGKPSLYVATSNGDIFDKKAAALARFADPVDGVYEEVDKAEKEAAARRAAQRLAVV
jgi:hypothetical protein